MKLPKHFTLVLLAACLSGSIAAEDTSEGTEQAERTDDGVRQYTFAWDFVEQSALAPRGGTTRGPGVDLVEEANPEYLAMLEPGLSAQERDRRAILAMAGPYRTSFDFLETVGFVEGYQPQRPYQSWGTEFVYVVEALDDFVSLQHVLVMVMSMPDGSESDPIVVKHWRQDWTYEPRIISTFVGDRQWETQRVRRSEARGRWLQSVYQVDDSPRYQAFGTWTHHANYSSWHSDETWRPLPRREFSVRDDYDVLIGTNKHTINPTGWVQEEENLKVALGEDGQRTVLAKEVGLARYERIAQWDWSAGDEYWARTGPFWAEVRAAWTELLADHDSVALAANVDGQRLFGVMFGLAEQTVGQSAASMRAAIDEQLARFASTR